MPFALAPDGAHLYYELHGPRSGTAPAIVFLHGNAGNHLSWWQQVPHFRDRYTCLVFDHRGWGRSTEPPGGRGGAAFADDVGVLMDAAGIGSAALVAQSMGGWSALGFAVEHPQCVDALVLCNTHGGLDTPEIAPQWQSALRTPAAVPPGVHPAAGKRMHRDQPLLHFLYEEIAALNPEMTPRERFAFIRSAGTRTAADAASLKVPVLCLTSDEDIVIPPEIVEAAAACFRHGRTWRVAQAGHSVYFERSGDFNAILDRFLAGAL